MSGTGIGRSAAAGPAADRDGGDYSPFHPVSVAITELGARVTRARRGAELILRLDGHPTGPREIVKAANELRLKRGVPAIPYPGLNGGKR